MGLTSSQSSSLTVPSDQLHGRRGGWRPWVSMVGYFRANHAAGVSSLTRFAGKFSKPGSTALRYSRTAICCLRHVSTIEMMAATRGPACSLPTWIQFLRLWKAFHNRNYEQSGIMQRSTGSYRDFGRWALGTVEVQQLPSLHN